MKRFLKFLSVMALTLVVEFAEAQTIVSNESFPNAYNTGFSAPVNGSFVGSIGTWTTSSTDARATIVCNNAYVQTTPNALKVLNYNNSSSTSASTCRATSPTINLSSLGCTNSVALSFKLYTYTLNVNNTCFSFFVEFSSDNGSTWTTIWTRTAQQLVQSFGPGTWTTQNIPIPANFYNSTFKYRIRGTQAAGCAYDSYLYVDDFRILSQACLTTCTTGFNPTANARGFNVFAKDGAKFMTGHTDGGVAMGGDLTLQGAATIAMNPSFLTYPVTSDKFGLVVGGKMVYNSGNMSYVNNGKIRLGSATNSRLFYKDCNNANTNFRVTPFNSTCATAYNSTPAIQQQSTSANSDPLDGTGINYADDFTSLQRASTIMSAYSAASSCSTSINVINVSGSTPTINLAANKVNVINITGAQLAALTNVTFSSAPTATNPLVINVNQTGSFNWTAPFASTGLTNAAGQFIIFNFYNATGDINITGSNVVIGTLFAPHAAINWNNTNNVEGQIIARYFTLNGGEIHYQRFSACLPECNPANPPCVTNVSLPGGHSAVYQGVSYSTVSGNIRSTFTYTVTSGSSPNISHFVFGNFSCETCFNDASDLISATQSPTVMGTDPTTGLCGLKFDFSVASGQSTTVSFTLNGYYDVGPVVFGTKAGTNTAFGYICGPVCSTTPPTFNLGNLVWFDVDGDGIKDNDETGIAGATVRLYNDANNDNVADGAAVATTTTNSTGNYVFSGLFTGNYIVGVVIPSGYKAGFVNGGDPDNNTDNDNNGIYINSGEVRSKSITLTLSAEPITDGDGNNGNLTLDFGLIDPAAEPKGSGEKCFVGSTNPNVAAKTTWSINPDNNTVTFRVTLAKTFVDNTYGTNKIGWPGNHTFGDLVGSDKLAIALYDATNVKKLDFTLDYITASSGAPSGYDALGVSGGEGGISVGSAANILSSTTSIDVNLNDYGYVLLTNSPATNNDYDPNPTYPKWIYDVWYEVTVSLSAFGTAGFGDIVVGAIHASPSKTGNNNETVVVGPCPGPLSLGNVVWYDNNNNGLKDVGENGIAGLNVKLYADADSNNVPDAAAIATTTTDANGMYSFDALNNGKYIVGVILPGGYGNGLNVATSTNPNNDTDNDNNGVTIVGNELRSNFITLTEGTEPTSDGTDNNTNYTLDFGILFTATGGEQCFASPTVPNTVNAKTYWTFNPLNQTVTLRTTFAKTFVDNTYGTSAIGWPGGHTFGNLTGSDKLQLALYDANGVKKIEFEQDYFSALATAPSGYQSLGVTGGDGGMVLGSASDVVSWKTSMDANFNDYGYVLTTNSPSTNTSYAPNATYPNWIYDVWYEVTVKLSAFGSAGFGYPLIADVHASPSKTGNNTEVVNPVTCPPNTFTIGNQVWIDINGNGIFNTGEPGLAGVTVNLYLDANNNNVADGAAIASTVTDADGKYSFTNLNAGNYIVGVIVPSGYTVVATNGGDPDNNTDNDNNGINVVGTEIRSNALTVSANAEPTNDGDGPNGNLSVDFALQTTLKVNLGNKVWFDTNNNGILDNGETGIAGTTVKLYADANQDEIPDGAALLTTVTNATGDYIFNNLNSGSYIVGVTIPSGYSVATTIGSSDEPNNNIDNDNNGVIKTGTEIRSSFITLTPGSEPTLDGDGNNGNLTLDFGFIDPALPPTGGEKCYVGTNFPSQVGARFQWNVNPAAGTVTIRATLSKSFVDNTYGTSAIGWPGGHSFGNLTGSDKLQIALFDGLNAKKLEFAMDYITASGTAPSGYKSLGVTGGDGSMVFGSSAAVLNVRTSMDVNFNEYGYILTTNSPVTDTSYTTNPTYPNWIYDVWYEVTVDLSVFGAAGFGDVSMVSVHASPSKTGNNTEPVTPTTCPNQLKLGNLVWKDLDNDGLKDTNEPGKAGVIVNLYADANGDNTPDGPFIATTVTNSNGLYSFSNLAPGNYIVGIVIPNGYSTVAVNGGDPDNNIDNDNNGVTVSLGEFRSNSITLSPNAEPVFDGDDANGNLTVDFAIFQLGNPGSLGDFVWEDVNSNGLQDANEPGIPDVLITLNGPGGTVVTSTNAAGYYEFTNLVDGNYTLTFQTPATYIPTASNQGTDDAIDSDPVNGVINVTLTGGQSVNTLDAGYLKQSICPLPNGISLGTLTNYLFVFTDGSSRANWQGASKGFIGNVAVDGIQANETTSGTVPYAGTIYTNNTTLQGWQNIVTNNASQATASYNQTGTINNLTNDLENAFTQINNLTATPGYTSVNAASLNGLNTQNNIGETFVFNITSGFSTSTLINITGDINDVYIFRWDTDANFSNGYQGQVTFQSGGAIVPNGGLTPSNFIHVAGNIGGSGGGSNPPLPYPQGPRTNNGTGALITGGSDFSGGGFFTGYWLTTGSPTITGSGQPYGATASLSNVIFVGGWFTKSNDFSITSGTSGVYVEPNFCVGSIGDFVWEDVNKDGIQNLGEPGIAGVVVSISGPTGNFTTTTDANGYYQFTNLIAGNYTLTFTTPDGFISTVSNAGANDSKDSDPVNGTVTVTLLSGESKQTVDAGFYKVVNLGNVVWNDINGNGYFENDEPTIPGVTVRLYADANGDNVPDGAAIATTTTNASGIYGFNSLTPGNYIVGIVIPTGYENTVSVVTSADPNNDTDDDNNGINLTGPNVAGTEVRSNYITLSLGGEPVDEGDGTNGNLTLDFGLQGLGGIGDFVWNDLDKDGIQDANEAGIQNVNVTLTYPNGFQTTVQTDENGYYFFPNLGPGNYTVTFETPLGQTPSPSNIGANDAIDSDPVAGVVNVTLAAGQINTTIDAGFYTQICTPIVANCGTGFIRKTTTLISNGNFSSPITSPAPGNAITNTCSSGIASAAAITYNYSGGSFKAQAEYDGVNTRPGGRSFEIITAPNLTTAFIDGSSINQLPFPGDPTNGVPSSLSWIYHRNDDFACERVLWEQTATGLVIGKTYTFRFYASNTRTDNQVDPILQIETGGTSGLANGTVQGTAVTLTEAGTANNTALNGWVRFNYTFTATSTNIILKIVDVANSNASGDEVGITAIGLDVCEKDTDGDCIVDVDDIDDDNDGILDIVESGGCDPLLDSDGDGIPNYKDSNAPGCQPWVDCNNDGINDNYDWDRDGIINELDLDSDNDGILDVQETRATNAVDNNFDGMVDGVDMDGDGLLSTADANDNVIGGPGLTPQDFDRDGSPNYLDLDSDGDGLTDITEALELYDTDGLTAGTDVDIDGVRAKGGLYTNADDNADNYNGFGAKGIKLKDFDADGKPNPYDIDSDQDGITDNVEGQPTCSYKIPCTTDIDGDGVGDCYDVNTSNCTSRTSGGITPYDKDGDGVPDIYDLDTDNDGAPDINEGSGKEGGFVTDYTDVDNDGLIGEFDNFNINTALSNFTNNVAHGNMGPDGNLDGPIPTGSLAELPQSQPGSCPTVDRDWRNVTILPVTLMEFKGSLNNSMVNLQWKVTNEVNVQRYVIERSTNGTNFIGIAAVNATTSTAAVKDYQHADNIASLNSTVVYYRLITEDFGGSKTYSNTIVFRLGKAKSAMALNPNPASNFFNVRVQATQEGAAVVRVLDMTGRVVLTNNTKLFTGSNTISFHNANTLAAGTYTVQMLFNNEVYTEKLVIMH